MPHTVEGVSIAPGLRRRFDPETACEADPADGDQSAAGLVIALLGSTLGWVLMVGAAYSLLFD